VKKQRPPREKFTPYYELLDACRQKECPICTKLRKAGRQYIDSLLYERVNDPGVREALRQSRGFCVRHTREAIELGDRLGMAIIYEDLLSRTLEDFTKAAKRVQASKKCPVCLHEEKTEDGYLRLTLDHLEDAEFQSALEESAPICFVHWSKLAALENSQSANTILLSMQLRKLRAILKDLKEFIRNHDYRFSHEALKDEEAISWRQAIDFFLGTC
jgi:hypothetical protein